MMGRITVNSVVWRRRALGLGLGGGVSFAARARMLSTMKDLSSVGLILSVQLKCRRSKERRSSRDILFNCAREGMRERVGGIGDAWTKVLVWLARVVE